MEETVLVNAAVKEAGADVATDLKTVIRDIQTLLKSAAANGTEMASSVRGQLEAALLKLQAQLIDLEKAAAARASEAGRATEAYVRENPWRAIGAAAGVGLIVGMLISRR
ncbi:MAG: DUF883 domain-containing protein [Bdellovibrionales bacterium]|nr:DUF883 domain-containing protein [Ramlibacter sp.]